MAADSKQAKLAKRLIQRLQALGCPYSDDVDESWISAIIFKPGEQRLKLLQWILSKFDSKVSELLDPSASFHDNTVDSRIQKLLFVTSNLGLCKYDDVDLIRGGETAANRQAAFFDQLLDVVTICDNAEDPMTKSMLTPGIVSESSSFDDQLLADSRYIDTLAAQQLPAAIFTPTVDLLPPDLERRIKGSKEITSITPDLQGLVRNCQMVETNLLRQLDVLADVQKMTANEQSSTGSAMQHASRGLDIILKELCQLTLSFSYCYETEMQPWCRKKPPYLSQLGPAFKRVHALLLQFCQMLTDLHKIRQCDGNLSHGLSKKLNIEDAESMLLVDASHEAVKTFQECVDILDTSINRKNPSSSLCSSVLKT